MASAGAPMSGAGGQNLGLALIMMDAGEGGRADPAFQAHVLPIGFWSMAVWNKWMPIEELNHTAWTARDAPAQAAHPWRLVYGPAAATVASCARLDWHVVDGATIKTDVGETMDLTVGPPAAVKRKVHDAVKRWRWERVEATVPKMRIEGASGAQMRPVWKA